MRFYVLQRMKRPFFKATIVSVVAALVIIITISIRLVAWPPNLISGVQSRNYSATPMTQLSIFYDLNRGKGVARQTNQLYVLAICQNESRDRSQFSESHLSERPSYFRYSHLRWKAANGMIDLPIRWDYWKDTVNVGKKTFDRNKGNVFVAVRQSDGQWESIQLGTLGEFADYDEAARYILKNYRGRLPNLEWSE